MQIMKTERMRIECVFNNRGEEQHENAYPIVMTPGNSFIVVFIPDFNINTQGKDYPEAIEMARDAIGVVGIDMEDDGEELPIPSDLRAVVPENDKSVVTLVDVDFAEYR